MPGSKTTALTKGSRKDNASKQAKKTQLDHTDDNKMKLFKADNRYEQVTFSPLGYSIRRNQTITASTHNNERRHICRVLPYTMDLDSRLGRSPLTVRVYLETTGVCDLFYTEMKNDELNAAMENGSLFNADCTFTEGSGALDFQGRLQRLVVSSSTPFTCYTSTIIKTADLAPIPVIATSQ